MTWSIIRTRHPMSPAAIHPVPPPNGKGKDRINFYYYTRPWICFFPTWNPCQMHPTVNKHPTSILVMFTCVYIPHPYQNYPLHAPPSHPASMASKIILNTVLIRPTLCITRHRHPQREEIKEDITPSRTFRRMWYMFFVCFFLKNF